MNVLWDGISKNFIQLNSFKFHATPTPNNYNHLLYVEKFTPYKTRIVHALIRDILAMMQMISKTWLMILTLLLHWTPKFVRTNKKLKVQGESWKVIEMPDTSVEDNFKNKVKLNQWWSH